MVEVARHAGGSALLGSAEMGQLLWPGENCGAQGVDEAGLHGLSAAPTRVGIGDGPLPEAATASRASKHSPLSVHALRGRELCLRNGYAPAARLADQP